MPTIPLSQNRLKFALDLFLLKFQNMKKKLLLYIKATRHGVFMCARIVSYQNLILAFI